MAGFRQLLRNTPQGLYCPPGDFHIDPVRPVAHAVITHGHSDHARSGHGAVLATPETLAIMRRAMAKDLPPHPKPHATVRRFPTARSA